MLFNLLYIILCKAAATPAEFSGQRTLKLAFMSNTVIIAILLQLLCYYNYYAIVIAMLL